MKQFIQLVSRAELIRMVKNNNAEALEELSRREQAKQKEREEKNARKQAEKAERDKAKQKEREEKNARKQAEIDAKKQMYQAQGYDFNYTNNGAIADHEINYYEWLVKSQYNICYNEFMQQIEVNGQALTDIEMHKMLYEMSIDFEWSAKRETFMRTMNQIADANRVNPVQEYLRGLTWDGNARADKIFIDWLGADDTSLNKEMTRKWLLSAIKRVMEPGCYVGSMIILTGAQGIGKSTICSALAKGFYGESVALESNPSTIPILNASWIVGVDELDTFNKASLTQLKTFLTQTHDTVTLKYQAFASRFPRHCVFIGSTNEATFLRDYDAQYERRYWTIDCHASNNDEERILKGIEVGKNFASIVDQIWAEAMVWYSMGMADDLNLSVQSVKDLTIVQSEHKMNNNDTLVEQFFEIATAKYILDDDGFISREDFVMQSCGKSVKQGEGKMMQYIPVDYINAALEAKSKRTAKLTYFINSNVCMGHIIKYNGTTDGKRRFRGRKMVCIENLDYIDNKQGQEPIILTMPTMPNKPTMSNLNDVKKLFNI